MSIAIINILFEKGDIILNIFYINWQLAEALNIVEFTLCRKLRHELSKEQKENIFAVIEQLKKKIGKPNKTYYTDKKISGASWQIPFEDKKSITQILSRPTLIGQRLLKQNKWS